MILVSNTSKKQNIAQISELGIEELRLVYDREESRNDTFETKAASLFGFSSLLVSILVFTLTSLLSNLGNIILVILAIINLIGIFVIFFSLSRLLDVLKISKYMTPFVFDPNELDSLVKMPSDALKKYILEDYKRSIPHIYCLNDKKADLLDSSVLWLKRGIIISFLPLILFLLIKITGAA